MTLTAAKDFFKTKCNELGLDCDRFIKLSAGNPNDPKRFRCQCASSLRTDSQLYIVKYFEKEDVYIAWNLKEPKAKAKGSFSLLKREVALLKTGQILPISKGIDYREWDAENVFAFRPNAVKRFLETYVIPRVR